MLKTAIVKLNFIKHLHLPVPVCLPHYTYYTLQCGTCKYLKVVGLNIVVADDRIASCQICRPRHHECSKRPWHSGFEALKRVRQPRPQVLFMFVWKQNSKTTTTTTTTTTTRTRKRTRTRYPSTPYVSKHLLMKCLGYNLL